MKQEQNYERHDDYTTRSNQDVTARNGQDFGMRRDRDFGARGNQGMTGDRDMRGSVSSFNEFLEQHGNISSDLSKNPSLATNEEYLETHPALRQYLQANPQVRQQLTQNPQSFVKSAQTFEATPKGSPKLPTDPKLK
jgi:hypothetical protein